MIFSTRRVIIPCLLLLILVDQILCSSGSSVIDEKEVFGHHKDPKHGKRILFSSSSISTTQMDITTPIITPSTPTSNTPTSPLYIPAPVNPTTTNPTTTSPQLPSGSWCVASKSASETALQVALDYACGYGGADCSAIQPGGICYNPNSVRDHASYAFNNYYQKKPLPTSCNFGGTAVIATTDPSSGTCHFPSTSTSVTILNITNPRGPSTVFGSTPSTSSTTSTAAMPCYLSRFFITTTCFMVLLPRTHLLTLLDNYY